MNNDLKDVATATNDPEAAQSSQAASRRSAARRARIRRRVILGAAVVAAVAPLSMTGLASASAALPGSGSTPVVGIATPYTTLTSNKCTAKIYRADGVSLSPNGQKQLVFKVALKCAANRTVRFQSQLWEQDNGKPGDHGGSDRVAQKAWRPWVNATSSTQTREVAYPVDRSFDSDRYGEFFQRVRIQVRVNGETAFGATGYKSGPVFSAFI